MRPKGEPVRRALVFVAAVTLCVSLGEASRIRPVNLEPMTERADRRGPTSPVGFDQGKFVLIEDKQGQRLAINQFGNPPFVSPA